MNVPPLPDSPVQGTSNAAPVPRAAYPPLPVLGAPQAMVQPPQVGGVIPDSSGGEVWVGGSNIVPLTAPIYLGQRRPTKYGSAATVEASTIAGIEFKLDRTEEGSVVTFTLWISLLAQAIKEQGLDSITLIPNSTWTQETNIIESYGKGKMV